MVRPLWNSLVYCSRKYNEIEQKITHLITAAFRSFSRIERARESYDRLLPYLKLQYNTCISSDIEARFFFAAAEELKDAKSSGAEDENEEETADEDAIREAVKAQKNSKDSGEEEEDDDDDDEAEDSASGSGRSASTIPNKPNKRSPHKVWKF